MMCTFRVAALATLVAWAHAAATEAAADEPVLIDSQGVVKKVMRRETPRRHLYREDPADPGNADKKGDATSAAGQKADDKKVADKKADVEKADATKEKADAKNAAVGDDAKPAVKADAKDNGKKEAVDKKAKVGDAAKPAVKADAKENDKKEAVDNKAKVGDAAKPAAKVDDTNNDKKNAVEAAANKAADVAKPAVKRTDLVYDYTEESMSSACDSHYEFKGNMNNDQCAEECYKTFGCHRFSAGGCSLGCRISVKGKNAPAKGLYSNQAPHDGQCAVSSSGDASGCVVYKLNFFRATHMPGYCSTDYEMVEKAETKAECAHACKNSAGCTKFSAEPNCVAGCRISKPAKERNHHQCSEKTDLGCTVYELMTKK